MSEHQTECKTTRCGFFLKDFPAQGSLLLLRLGLGFLGLTHGYPKLLLLFDGRGATWLNPIGIGSTLSLILCTCAEFLGSLGLIVGYKTRLWALLLFINFYIIVFVSGMAAAWGVNELALLYLICYTALIGLGGGRFSIDYCLHIRRLEKDESLQK